MSCLFQLIHLLNPWRNPGFSQVLREGYLEHYQNMNLIARFLKEGTILRKIKLRAAKQQGNMANFEAWLPEFRTKQADLQAKATALEDEIYQANQVKPLKIEVRPSTATPKPTAGRSGKKGAEARVGTP